MPREDSMILKIDPDAGGHDISEFNTEGQLDSLRLYSWISIDNRMLYIGRYDMPSIFKRPPWQLLIRDEYYDIIRIIDLQGNEESELIRIGGGDFGYVAWSPDGTQIAFTQRHRDAATYELAIMDADGSGLRIYDQVMNPDVLVWSPDGSRIAVVEQTKVIEERHDDKFHYEETINHDRLAVVRLSDGFTQRFNEVMFSNTVRYNLRDDGSRSYRDLIYNEPRGNEVIKNALEWSGKDDLIYFSTKRYDAGRPENSRDTPSGELIASTIYSINPDGTDRRMVFQIEGNVDIRNLSVAPDGRKILFVTLSDRNIYPDSSSPLNLHVMNSDGTGIRRVAGHMRWHGYGAWSPDSSKIAFYAEFRSGWGYRPQNDEVYVSGDGLFVMNVDGTEARLLLHWDREGNISLNEERWRFDPNESILVGVENE